MRLSCQRMTLRHPHSSQVLSVTSWGSCRHAATSDGTTPTGLGASLTVLHRVLGTLSCAGLAHLSAQRKDRRHVLVAPCDRRCGKAANIGAFHIQRNATSHQFWILFLETGASALKAGCCAFVAREKAFFLFFAKHFNLLKSPSIRYLIVAPLMPTVCAPAHQDPGKTTKKKWTAFRRRAQGASRRIASAPRAGKNCGSSRAHGRSAWRTIRRAAHIDRT